MKGDFSFGLGLFLTMFAIVGLIVLGVVCGMYALYEDFTQDQDTGIEFGRTYLYAHDWSPENPFEKLQIDTVTVLSEKDGYYQYQYKDAVELSKDGMKMSGEGKYLRKHIRSF